MTYRLEALDEAETIAYIRHRLAVGGGSPQLFHRNALRLIYRNSGGIPRVINTLCDLALVYGYANGKHQIDAVLIADIARDRVVMGLYGDQAYDVSSLTSAGRAEGASGRQGREPARAGRARYTASGFCPACSARTGRGDSRRAATGAIA